LVVLSSWAGSVEASSISWSILGVPNVIFEGRFRGVAVSELGGVVEVLTAIF
jgi:hypothetical protein